MTLLLILMAVLPFLAMAAFAVRPSAIAGSWYPGTSRQLTRTIEDYLEAADIPSFPGRPRALIAPHAGYVYSGPCAAYAYKMLQGQSYDRVLLMGPSHRAVVGGVSVADYDAFETPLGEIPLDLEACTRLIESAGPFVMDRNAHAAEHSLEIQLPFLQHMLGEFKLVPMVLQGVGPEGAEGVAEALTEIVGDQTLVVVSSDFTHYGQSFGYLPFTSNVVENLEKIDLGAARLIEQNDLEGFVAFCDKHRCTICGREPITVVMSLAKKIDLGAPRILHYTTSAESTGDTSHVVSYVAMGYFAG